MPSGSDYAKRLLDEAHRSFAPHLGSLQEAVQSLRSHLSVSLDQLVPKIEAIQSVQLQEAEKIISEAVAEIRQTRPPEIGILASFSRDLLKQETQEEILNLLLESATHFAPRLALFVTRGEQINGWASRGYPAEIADHIRKCSFPATDSAALRRLLSEDDFSVSTTNCRAEVTLQGYLKADPAEVWHFLPMKAMERPVAILLAAETGGQPCELSALQVLTGMSVLYLENLAFKILQELGAHAPAQKAAPVVAAVALPPPVVLPEEEPTEIIPAETPVSESPSTQGAEETRTVEPVIALGPPQPAVDAEVEAMVETIGLPGPEPADGSPFSKAPTLVTDRVPAPKPPAPAETQKLSEEEKLHADARRFARLLVSEIKLYNEQKLREGRANRDVYVRLKRDIDRSREMYERRVPTAVTRNFDYFNDEVVRILADNDPAKLGTDYPGSRVEG